MNSTIPTPETSRPATPIAFKEWATVIRALEMGHQTLLLRKGGIREDFEFKVEHRRFLLYPTYLHQDASLLQPRWHDLLKETETEEPPLDQLHITGYAEVAELFHLKDEPAVNALRDHYVWNENYVRLRFQFKPEWPLYGMVLRAYRLPEKIELPYRFEYGGCKSWIDLERALAVDEAIPALSDAAFADRLEQLRDPLRDAARL